MHLLIMQRTWPHFILKEHHPTQEWLKTWCTDWIVQQEWCLLSYTFLWNRAPQPTNTPGETLLCGSWLAAKVPSYKLQGPFLVQELFFMLSLSYQVASIQEKWQCTDRLKLIRTETLEKMNELLEGVDLWTLQVIHGQPTINTFCCGFVISSNLKGHLVLTSFATCKTGPPLK